MAKPWEATLGTADVGALEDLGLEPCGIVLGTCVVQQGFNQSSYGMSSQFGFQNINQYSGPDPIHLAWQTSISRLLGDAAARGAHGVVGVEVNFIPTGEGRAIELMIKGTAVRRAGHNPPAIPFSTIADARQIVKLLSAGLAPRQVVLGYFVERVSDYITSMQMQSWQNTEVTFLSRAATQVRNSAIDDMVASARSSGCEQIIGTKLSSHTYEYEVNQQTYFTLYATAVGTGVYRVPKRMFDQRPITMMRLRDKADPDSLI